jgi:hypothetical protein
LFDSQLVEPSSDQTKQDSLNKISKVSGIPENEDELLEDSELPKSP